MYYGNTTTRSKVYLRVLFVQGLLSHESCRAAAFLEILRKFIIVLLVQGQLVHEGLQHFQKFSWKLKKINIRIKVFVRKSWRKRLFRCWLNFFPQNFCECFNPEALMDESSLTGNNQSVFYPNFVLRRPA